MTWEIRMQGKVQGVGFRPFVWRAAHEFQFTGWVANGPQGVHIVFNAPELARAQDFLSYLCSNAPATAHITSYHLEKAAQEHCFDAFSIQESHADGQPVLHLTPDIALCDTCRTELHQPDNRRYGYPFTTCTRCGPRYSILQGLPYDRPLTTMSTFDMCPNCLDEYHNPADRRYFAQTNSCPDCGITLLLNNQPIPYTTGIQTVVWAWEKGEIVAIKGTGGFLLTCDATQRAALENLRMRKQRPSKPFAIMYPNMDTLQKDATVSDTATQWLTSDAAPIVLVPLRQLPGSGIQTDLIAPELSRIGAMLPNAPLLELLLHQFGKPIVATSANISHEPLVYTNEEALESLTGIADHILSHNRDITIPQDDSVVATTLSGKSILLRRARGMAPAHIQAGLASGNSACLALGAEMKSTFALSYSGNVHLSAYIGDTAAYAVQQRYRYLQNHLLNLFHIRPDMVLTDLHPGYFTTGTGAEFAAKWSAKQRAVQHHQAHFAAVLAENNLIHSTEPVLGVIWDGTGYGTDGHIWGGEFFIYQNYTMERCAHIPYFPIILGDKMPRQPRISALCACAQVEEAHAVLEPKFTAQEWLLYPKMIAASTLRTSSMGRLFDAVASILGLGDHISYEGEAAMYLENMASNCAQPAEWPLEKDYLQEGELCIDDLFRQILSEIQHAIPPAQIALRFHITLIRWIANTARQYGIRQIAFSGGVFQNTLLVDMADQLLVPDFDLFIHQQLSPNDENIAFGQWAFYHIQNSTLTHYVSGNSR